MKISIGIMLWNEESTIEMTLHSLFGQTLFTKRNPAVRSIEVVVLANGCTDASVPNAQRSIDSNLAALNDPAVTGRVVELPKGRSPAWNRFVHEITAPDVEYLVLMDADIVFNHQNAVQSMVDGLSESDYHHVAAALGVKDVDLQSHKTVLQYLTSAMTRMEHDARFYYLCGGLYCGKSEFLRRLVFPDGFICGDDGFIAGMAVTNFLTTDYQFDRILYPEDASFIFEAYTTIPKLFRQNRRRLIGARVRRIIHEYVRSKQVGSHGDAGVIIKEACNSNPSWLLDLTEETIVNSGFWVIPGRDVFYRLRQLTHISWSKKIRRFPLALAGTLWQFALILSANRMFQRREHSAAWTNMQNTRLTNSSSIEIGPG